VHGEPADRQGLLSASRSSGDMFWCPTQRCPGAALAARRA
jgi:hypothetical protein